MARRNWVELQLNMPESKRYVPPSPTISTIDELRTAVHEGRLNARLNMDYCDAITQERHRGAQAFLSGIPYLLLGMMTGAIIRFSVTGKPNFGPQAAIFLVLIATMLGFGLWFRKHRDDFAASLDSYRKVEAAWTNLWLSLYDDRIDIVDAVHEVAILRTASTEAEALQPKHRPKRRLIRRLQQRIIETDEWCRGASKC